MGSYRDNETCSGGAYKVQFDQGQEIRRIEYKVYKCGIIRIYGFVQYSDVWNRFWIKKKYIES